MGLPLWREAFVGLEWLSLRASAVYRGIDVPRGDGSAVVVIPGFLGSDAYLRSLYTWLQRIGYRPYMSAIGRNAQCPNLLLDRLFDTIEGAYDDTGGKVHLIGHSLGGVLARAAAVLRPGRIASVIAMASPFRGVRAHPLIVRTAALVRRRVLARGKNQSTPPEWYSGFCTCDALNALRQPFPAAVPQVAIYTKSDGVVDWRLCINDDPTTDIEVSGTHVGLVFNSRVYGHIAARLAASQNRRRRSRRRVKGEDLAPTLVPTPGKRR